MRLYNNYFDSFEETYDEGDLNEKEGRNQFKITGMGVNKLPEWLKSKNDFNEAKKLVGDIRIDMSHVKVGYKDKKVFNDLNRLITDISNNKVKKEDSIKRFKKYIFDLNQLRQKSTVFQNKMIQVIHQLFNSFGLNKKVLPLFSKKQPDQLRLPDYMNESSSRFYELKNNISNNKGLMTRVTDTSGKTITIDIKDASNLMDQISKNEITYDEVKMIFSNIIVSAADKIALTNPTNNKT